MSNPIPLFPSPEPADVPWLDVLRQADGYNLDVEQEARLIEAVEETGLPATTVRATAESLAEQWPYKKRKHIDRTFRAWLWREVDRRARPQRPRDNPDAMRDYLERKRRMEVYLKAQPEQDQRQA